MDHYVLPLHVPGLVVQSQKGHRGVNGLPALGTQPHDLQTGLVDLLCELIDSNVTGSAHQHWTERTKVALGTRTHPFFFKLVSEQIHF